MFDSIRRKETGSLWSHLFDDDGKQREDIDELQRQADALERELGRSHELADQLRDLRRDLCAVALFDRALLALLVEKGIVTPAELEAKLRAEDLKDGKLDGR